MDLNYRPNRNQIDSFPLLTNKIEVLGATTHKITLVTI